MIGGTATWIGLTVEDRQKNKEDEESDGSSVTPPWTLRSPARMNHETERIDAAALRRRSQKSSDQFFASAERECESR
ncbi:hypothetical protein NL676_009679 [Syzygium grande]|nr:hypothetical protein NL676_009679 [Syzygium grande]